jgi:hypothetical protein
VDGKSDGREISETEYLIDEERMIPSPARLTLGPPSRCTGTDLVSGETLSTTEREFSLLRQSMGGTHNKFIILYGTSRRNHRDPDEKPNPQKPPSTQNTHFTGNPVCHSPSPRTTCAVKGARVSSFCSLRFYRLQFDAGLTDEFDRQVLQARLTEKRISLKRPKRE